MADLSPCSQRATSQTVEAPNPWFQTRANQPSCNGTETPMFIDVVKERGRREREIQTDGQMGRDRDKEGQ